MQTQGRPHVGICLRKFAHTGGASQALLGLFHALGKLDDGPERYSIVVQSPELMEWLRPYCGPNQRLLVHPHLGERNGAYHTDDSRLTITRILKAALGPLRPAARYVQHLLTPPGKWPEIPLSDGFVESLDCDVVHFPAYWFMLCNLPTIYNPHDLGHLRFPHYVSQGELTRRDVLTYGGCRYSHTVVVGTQWVKDDVVRRYGIDPEKVQITPWASPTEFYREPNGDHLTTVIQKYQIERPFAILPANTWPHKNHLRLLDALAHLRDTRGLVIRLVCTGALVEWFWPQIKARLHELKMESQVKFLGSVPNDDLRALYRLSQFLVMPTLYEADSNPIHEAWFEDVPVASSNVTALPDQVRDAGILFDPWDVRAIADAVARMATDEALREDLRQRGRRRRKDFSWERTAKAYRAVYRRAADHPLTEEDRWLLQWDWLREPDKTFALDLNSPRNSAHDGKGTAARCGCGVLTS
jgi:glycosyltransferase involved in cell wall biosynthesis